MKKKTSSKGQQSMAGNTANKKGGPVYKLKEKEQPAPNPMKGTKSKTKKC